MNKKRGYIFGSITLSIAFIAICFALSLNGSHLFLSTATNNSTWVHYSSRNPTYADFGIKEYWIECGGGYQFEAPLAANIQEGGNNPDTSEFLLNDNRWNKNLIPYSFDQSNRASIVDAKAYNATANEDQTWWGQSYACLQVLGPDSLKYKQYDTQNFIEYFPRINFLYYREVNMNITLNIWKSGGIEMGFNETAFTNGTHLASSSGDGTISFVSNGDSVTMTLTYLGSTVLNETTTDMRIISGQESVKLFLTGTTSGDFYMTITNFVATPAHIHNWDAFVLDYDSTYTTKGRKHHTCLECGETEYVDIDYKTYEAGYLLNNPHCSDNVIQLMLPNDFPLADGQYGVTNSNAVVVKHDGTDYPLINASNDTIFVTTNGEERYLSCNFNRLGYHTIGSWSPGSILEEGDTITFNGTFIGLDNTILGQKFNVSSSSLYTKNVSSNAKHFYFYLPISSLETSEDIWTQNNFFQFYSTFNGISLVDDENNVGKYRPISSDCIKVYRDGTYFNIGKDNDGWYDAVYKETENRYIVKFASSSLNVNNVIGAIQSNDVVIIDGLFTNPNTNDQIYIQGKKPVFIQTGTGSYGWAVREYQENISHEKLNLGVWNGSYHFHHDQQLVDIAEQGVNVIIGVNPYWTSESNWLHTLDVADSLGLKFIVDPRKYNSSTGSYDIWDGTKPSYAEHNAVLGFDIWDEPSTTNFSTIASLKSQFDAVMPSGKLFFVNLLSSLCGLDSLYGTSSGKTLSSQYYETNYATYFHNTVNPDLYSWDSYPLFTNGKIRKSYFCDFDIWSYMAKNYDMPLWYTLLAAAHDSGDGLRYIVPTAKELRWQMSVAITYGITNMLDYIYATSDTTYVCMANLNDGQITSYSDIFYDMGTVNNEFRSWEEVYFRYEWQGVKSVKSGTTNYLFNDLRHTINLSSYGVSSISSTADILVGAFTDSANNNAYMITNAGKSTSYGNYSANITYTNVAGTVTMNFPSSILGVRLIKNGVATYQPVNGTSVTLNLDAYGSLFVIPVK